MDNAGMLCLIICVVGFALTSLVDSIYHDWADKHHIR